MLDGNETQSQVHTGTCSRPYLVVAGIVKSYGTNTVLNQINFFAAQGDLVSILGPSGSGKSTLLRIIAGLEVPDKGHVVCDNTTYFSDLPSLNLPVERRDIGMVFQDFGLWPHLTALEHVMFPLWSKRRKGMLNASKSDIKHQALQALEMFRMQHLADKKPQSLSGGQQQRIAFARAVVARPRLVLLDEAFSALDPQLRMDVRTELVSILRHHRMTVLNVTHDQEEAMAISDSVLVLHQGQQLQYSSPSDVYLTPLDPIVASFVGRGNVVQAHYDGHLTIQLSDGQCVLLARPLEETRGEPIGGHLLIRPESIQLVETGAVEAVGAVGSERPNNTLVCRGVITRQTQVVGRTEIYCDVPLLGQLRFYHAHRIETGLEVELRIELKHPHFIPDREGRTYSNPSENAVQEES